MHMRENVKVKVGRWPRWILSVATLCAVLWLTLMPQPLGEIKPPPFPGADKVVHAVMFAALAAAMLIDYARRREWIYVNFQEILTASLISLGVGIGIEILQGAMGLGRSFDFLDIIADAVGVTLIAIFWPKIERLWTR